MTLGAKRRLRSENGERKLAEMTIFADRCCPCGEVKAKKEYQEGGGTSLPRMGRPSSLISLIPHPLPCHCRLRDIAGEDAFNPLRFPRFPGDRNPRGCSLMKYADKNIVFLGTSY